MGTSVGSLVGILVGVLVGTFDGDDVGAAVGGKHSLAGSSNARRPGTIFVNHPVTWAYVGI